MGDLHEQLTAAVNARLETARALVVDAQRVDLELKDPRMLGRYQPGWFLWPRVETVARQLTAACERDLRVLERHAPEERFGQPGIWWCSNCGGQTQWRDCVEVTDLASAYGMGLE